MCYTFCIAVRFEWDDEKNRINQWKHNGLAFKTAALAFNDPLAVFRKDRVVAGEQRWHAIGSASGAVLLVVHVAELNIEGRRGEIGAAVNPAIQARLNHVQNMAALCSAKLNVDRGLAMIKPGRRPALLVEAGKLLGQIVAGIPASISHFQAAGRATVHPAGVATVNPVGLASMSVEGVANIELMGVASLDGVSTASQDVAAVAQPAAIAITGFLNWQK